jgi:endonuclease/exonuclease/phosphatase family metal-dependent hydrolase
MVISLVGLLTWAMLALSAAGPREDAPDRESSPTPFRLTAAAMKKGGDTSFHVASFNLLGWAHTAKGGDAKGYAGGVKRMEYAYRILQNHHVNVVGFQEMQTQQFDKFNALTGKHWALYPGNRLEQIAMNNSIAWKTSKWERVDASYLRIPYFWGEKVKMPVVKLRNRATGRLVYFANFHNPADTHGNAQKWRDAARRKEIRLANRKFDEGVPLVLTGDMNERDKYFCNMVAKAPMHAANGGSNAAGSRCQTPVPMGIDWIFGSKGLQFADYKKVESDLVHKTTDHPFIVARATVPGR